MPRDGAGDLEPVLALDGGGAGARDGNRLLVDADVGVAERGGAGWTPLRAERLPLLVDDGAGAVAELGRGGVGGRFASPRADFGVEARFMANHFGEYFPKFPKRETANHDGAIVR
mgnify:FL=1